MIGIIILAAAALAAEPVGGVDNVHEITVHGEYPVILARDQVVRSFEDMGYRARSRGDRVVFRPPSAWMGRASLYRDGRVAFGRPVLGLRSAQLQESGHYDAGDVLDREDHLVVIANDDDVAGGRAPTAGRAQVQVTPTATVYVLPSRRLLDSVRVRVLDAIGPQVDGYRAAVDDAQHRRRIEVLPGLLDRLWDQGVGLDGVARHDTPGERRRAALDYWSNQDASPAGDEISAVVALWLREVVQGSEHPVTPEERANAEARRVDERLLAPGAAPR